MHLVENFKKWKKFWLLAPEFGGTCQNFYDFLKTFNFASKDFCP